MSCHWPKFCLSESNITIHFSRYVQSQTLWAVVTETKRWTNKNNPL